MGFEGISSLFDFFVLFFGFYAIYGAYILQKDGTVTRIFLLSKDVDMNTCKDLQGYANFMGPKLRTLGYIMAAYGAIALANTYLIEIPTLFLVAIIVLGVVLIWYAMSIKKAMTKYF